MVHRAQLTLRNSTRRATRLSGAILGAVSMADVIRCLADYTRAKQAEFALCRKMSQRRSQAIAQILPPEIRNRPDS